MKLYLVRHATAEAEASDDASRRLTPEGRDEARIVGRALHRLKLAPELILSSPLVRARETARLVAGELKPSPEYHETVALGLHGTLPAILQAVRRAGAPGSVILVGHMPSLAAHLAHLLGAPNPAPFEFSKGSVACVELDPPTARTASLRWFLRQRQLAVLAGE